MTHNQNPAPFVPANGPVPGPHVPPAAQMPPAAPLPPGAAHMPQGAAMAPEATPTPAPGAPGAPSGQATPTPAPAAPGTPDGQDFARYQPTAPSTGDTVDTGWVTTKGKSSGRLQKEWHMTVYREWPIPEGLKWVPTAWKWFYYILMTAVFAVSFYYGIYLRF